MFFRKRTKRKTQNQLLGSFYRNFLVILLIMSNVGHYLHLFISFVYHFAGHAFVNINIWPQRETPISDLRWTMGFCIWEVSGGVWGHLEASGGIWRQLGGIHWLAVGWLGWLAWLPWLAGAGQGRSGLKMLICHPFLQCSRPRPTIWRARDESKVDFDCIFTGF